MLPRRRWRSFDSNGASRFAPGQPPAVTFATRPQSPPALVRSFAGGHFTRRSGASAAEESYHSLTSRFASLCLQRTVPRERTSGRSERIANRGTGCRAEGAGRFCRRRQEGIVSCRCAGPRNPGRAPARSRFPRSGYGLPRNQGNRLSVADFPTGFRLSGCWPGFSLDFSFC
jgi:hypothetical protein